MKDTLFYSKLCSISFHQWLGLFKQWKNLEEKKESRKAVLGEYFFLPVSLWLMGNSTLSLKID